MNNEEIISAAKSLLAQWKSYQETAGSHEEAYFKLAKYAYPARKDLEAALEPPAGWDVEPDKQLEILRQENKELRACICKQAKEHRREVSEIMSDPTYYASGVYKFSTPYKDRYFTVEILRGDIRLIENHKDHDLILMRI